MGFPQKRDFQLQWNRFGVQARLARFAEEGEGDKSKHQDENAEKQEGGQNTQEQKDES